MINLKFFTPIVDKISRIIIKTSTLLIVAILLTSSCNTFLGKQPQVLLVTPIGEWKLYDVENITWSMDSLSFAVLGNEKDDNVFGVYMYRASDPGKDWFHKVDISFGLAFSPDNQVIAIPTFPLLILLDQNTGELIKEVGDYKLQPCFGIEQIKYSSDGKKIFSLNTVAGIGNEYSEIFVWDSEGEQCQGSLIQEKGTAFNFELSQDGEFLVLGLSKIGKDAEQQVHVWDIGKKKIICSFPGGEPVSFSSRGNIIAAKNLNNQKDIDLWDSESCNFIVTIHSKIITKVYSADISPDGKLLAIGGSDAFQIWDVVSRKLMFESEKLPNAVKILAFSPNGNFLLTEMDRISMNDQAIITLWSVTNK
ncbi:MAG: hypothetical protein AB1509_01070 [Chloroflexota bacterium]|nr:hypothetical protein [Chloroflexota bacterium]WKZ36200.1 MAG: hypothetical protein QY332_21570 [Anaerolineales bacterium]